METEFSGNKLQKLINKREKINKQIEEYKKLCPHVNLKGVYRANTGNYDPSDDCYWVELSCPDCGSFWTEDQKAQTKIRTTIDGYPYSV